MKIKIQTLLPFLLIILTHASLSAQAWDWGVGAAAGGSFDIYAAPITDSTGFAKMNGASNYYAPQLYYIYDDNVSFSLGWQLGFASYRLDEDSGFFQEESVMGRSTFMLKANFFSLSNTWDEDGISIMNCTNPFSKKSYDCLDIGFSFGIGREWTSGWNYDNYSVESTVTYPIDLGVGFNFFHDALAVLVYTRLYPSKGYGRRPFSVGGMVTWNLNRF